MPFPADSLTKSDRNQSYEERQDKIQRKKDGTQVHHSFFTFVFRIPKATSGKALKLA